MSDYFAKLRDAFKKEYIYNRNEKNAFDRTWVASHPHCSFELLDLLSQDPHWEVRYKVALHPNTSAKTLINLCDDPEIELPLAVFWHPNTPNYIKQYLQAKKYLKRVAPEQLAH